LKGLFIAFVLFCSLYANAQTDSLNPHFLSVPSDSTYIADYTQKFTTRLFILFQDATFLINPENISYIEYKPNLNARVGIAGFWKWFGLGLSIENPFYKRDNDIYGKTTFIDLRVNAFGRAVAAELFFQQYKGFYISSPSKDDGTYYIRPDMKSMSLGIAAYWIYNAKRFSIRAAFIQNERQKKSAGSLIVMPSFLYYYITSDTGIIPTPLMNEYRIPQVNQVMTGKIYSVGLSPGYNYTFVFGKYFYLTAAILPGVFWHSYSYANKTGDHLGSEFSLHLNGRFATGYNSDKWFIGGSVQIGWNEVPYALSHVFFNYDVAQFRIWGGTRFNWFSKKKKK